ncbi:hypothetical protein C9J12_15150 [Photobacterium frigidiphilum]|uniref:Uncharacterized protein n=1 Tax=Photobacterium frigidiphilum TaxID=264736 RepID=A0A2T3JEJ5_9GAMM|nr:hypothetical protein [Photobacterium frigidiphilum]PSU47335.1 hypothetical protein C9J12_15150 [Photobacterium frigidiphilum]
MNEAVAIKQVSPSEELDTEYKNAIVNVSRYALAVAKTGMPSLLKMDVFKDWDLYTEQFFRTKTSADVWTSNIGIKLVNLPRQIKSSNSIIEPDIESAKTLSSQLLGPLTLEQQSSVLSTLKFQLGMIDTNISMIVRQTAALVDSLHHYNGSLETQTQDLNSLTKQTLAANEVEQDKIKELNKLVKELEDRVNKLSWELVGLGVAEAGVIGLTAVSIAAGPVGWAAAPFLAVAAAITGYYIVLDSIELVACQDLIEAKHKLLEDREKDGFTLERTAAQFSGLVDSANEAKEHLSDIVKEWESINSDVKNALASCQAAEKTIANGGQLSMDELNSVNGDISDIGSKWQSAVAKAAPLEVSMELFTNEITIGMDQEEIKQELSKNKVVSLAEYSKLQA